MNTPEIQNEWVRAFQQGANYRASVLLRPVTTLICVAAETLIYWLESRACEDADRRLGRDPISPRITLRRAWRINREGL